MSESAGSSTSWTSSESEPPEQPPYNKVLQMAVLALLFLTPLIFPWRIQYAGALNYRFSSFLIPKEAFALLVIVSAACYWLIAMARGGTLRFRSHPILLPIAVFTALAGVSVLYSPTRYTSAIDFAKLFTVIVFFLVSLNAFFDQNSARLALYAIFFSGLIVAALSILQLAGGLSWLFPRYPGNPQRMYSTFGNDSGVAGYLLPVLPIGIGLFLTSRSKGAKWIWFASTGAIAYAILACHTRGVWLGAFVALVFFLVNMVRRRELRGMLTAHGRYTLLAAVLAVILVVAQLMVPGASTDEIDTLDRITSTFTVEQVGVNLRAVFWGAALRMVADRPVFGFGLGSYKYYSQLYQGKLMAALGPASWLQPNELETVRAHNDYVQLASELGALGVAVLVWGMFVFWKCVRERLRRTADASSSCILLSCLAGLTGVAVFAATNFPFHLIAHALVSMFLLAVVVGAGVAEHARFSRWRLPQRPILRTVMSISVTAFGILFLALALRPYVADYHVATAALIGEAERRSNAELAQLSKASRVEPGNGSIRARLGRAYLLRGMIDKAKAEFARALGDYDAAWVHINYGLACETQGNLREAIQHYSDAVFRVPRYAAAHERLVRALMKAGRHQDARKRAEEALQWVGDTPALLNSLASVTYRMGDKEGSRVLLERSIQMEPDQVEIRRILRRLEAEAPEAPAGTVTTR